MQRDSKYRYWMNPLNVFLYCFRLQSKYYRFYGQPIARFLVFHDILPDDVKKFEEKLEYLKAKTNVISMDDYFSKRMNVSRINTVISFDDGFKSWISKAIPILKKLELPAIFFVSMGFVGLSKEKQKRFAHMKLFRMLGPRKISGGLDFKDLQRIVNEGFTLGGHTINHPIISEIENPQEIKYEIAEDKLQIEKAVGCKVEYFAYPYGDYTNKNANIFEMLDSIGYRGAVTTIPGFNAIDSNCYQLRRNIISASMPFNEFKSSVYGDRDAMRALRRIIAKMR
jgi:peptidoglycan/xylan/chitin deacetylase (PgdA/CDA1 family)